MTRERALELAYDVIADVTPGREPLSQSAVKFADAILAAVAEEREACAKIADSYDCNEFLAKEIRERGAQKFRCEVCHDTGTITGRYEQAPRCPHCKDRVLAEELPWR